MKKYVQSELRRYLDDSIIQELKKCQYSQKAERSMQSALIELIRRLDSLETETSEKNDQIKTLSEALIKQQKEVLRRNEAEDREAYRPEDCPEMDRDEKIRRMYANGYSQRYIAQDVGICQSRVHEIIWRTDHPLFNLNVTPENFLKFTRKRGAVSQEERDLKICEWRDMGYTLKQIARGTGLSFSRISEIVSEKCTQVQKTDTLTERVKKKGVHRNTQAKIEKVRKVAPWLAEKCEAGEVKADTALKQMESILGKKSRVSSNQPYAFRSRCRLPGGGRAA